MRDLMNSQGTAAVAGAVGLTPAGYDTLVAAIYSARTEADWRAPMVEAARIAGATAIQLVCVQPAARQLVLSVQVGASARTRAGDWLAEGMPALSRQRALWDMAEGDCIRWEGDLASRFPLEDRWWQDTVLASRATEVTAMRLLDQPGVSAWMLVARPSMAPTVAAETASWLHRAKGHLARALMLQADTLRRPVLRAGGRVARRLSDTLLDQLCHPVLLVGPDGDIRFANRRAGEALAEGKCILSRDGVLACLHPSDERQVRSALRLVLAGDPWSDAQPEASGKAVEIRCSGGSGSRVLFVSRLSVQGDPVALVVSHDPMEVPEFDTALIGRVFNLTPAEARIAAMLAQGLTPEQVSERQGTTLATVRSQIKALFVKTGTNRQVDVVRLVASLPAFEALRGGVPRVNAAASSGTGSRGIA